MKHSLQLVSTLGPLLILACGQDALDSSDLQAEMARSDGTVLDVLLSSNDEPDTAGIRPDVPGPMVDDHGKAPPPRDAQGDPRDAQGDPRDAKEPHDLGALPHDVAPPETVAFHAFMAVHLDPGKPAVVDGSPATERASTYLPTLQELIEASEPRGHRLTLMFTAQWAFYLSSESCVLPDDGDDDGAYLYAGQEHETCLSLVRAWEQAGHELAAHHHPQWAPATWDGFSNEPEAGGPDCLGDIDALMSYLAPLPQGGLSSFVSATTEEFPTNPILRYTAGRGPTPYVDDQERGDLASRPCAWTGDGHPVWRLRMRSFTTPAVRQTVLSDELPRAIGDLNGASPAPYTLGFVTHAKDVDGALPDYLKLFADLADAGIQMETVKEVASRYPYTAGSPTAAVPVHRCPPDERLTPP